MAPSSPLRLRAWGRTSSLNPRSPSQTSSHWQWRITHQCLVGSRRLNHQRFPWSWSTVTQPSLHSSWGRSRRQPACQLGLCLFRTWTWQWLPSNSSSIVLSRLYKSSELVYGRWGFGTYCCVHAWCHVGLLTGLWWWLTRRIRLCCCCLPFWIKVKV